MFRIYKQQYTVLNKSTGQRETRQSRNYYIAVPQGGGRRPKAVPGYKDRKATEAKAIALEQQLERIDSGILTADVDQAARPLAEHLADYLQALRDKGDGAGHVQLTRRRLELLVEGCRWRRVADMRQGDVLAYLAKCRRGQGPTLPGRMPKKMSRETSNHYIRAVKAFAAWLVPQRAALNPLAGLPTANPEVDRRHVRRTLTDAELARLLAAAKTSPAVRCGLPGPDRWALYLLAAYSGFRCGELSALALSQLQLDSEPPCVAVAAADEKAGRGATIPLPAGIAAELRPWLAGRPGPRVFPPGSWARGKAAQMLRGDLKAAGISYRDVDGRVFDFHALRSQYATALARAGVDLRTTQRLMRHSTPLLTAKHYTRLDLEDLADAAGKLPSPLL